MDLNGKEILILIYNKLLIMDDTHEEENNNAYLYIGLWQKITVTIRIVVEYIYSDIKKKPRSFKIGLFTIYLVVMFLALI